MPKVLLMTGTIKPFIQVFHNDPEKRLKEYKAAIKKYIEKSLFTTIIFADNSGYPADFSDLQTFANSAKKQLIVLSFPDAKGNNMSTSESALMRKVINKCAFLDNEEVVWKVTGRLYINNINKILTKHTSNENVFLYSKVYDSVETWLFCARIADLKEYFLTNETIGAMETGCIEYAWMDCIRKNNISVTSFRVYPDAIGVRSSGELYTNSRKKLMLKTVLLRLGRYSVKRAKSQKKREEL